MNEEELNANLGTIAKSGTKGFLESLSGDKKKDSNLIGQFGVGFYSSFMVAQKVVVTTKKPFDSKAWTWISDGGGEYEILECSKDDYGTEIALYLKDDCGEFANRWGVENIIKKYSNNIQFPIFLHYEEEKKGEGDEVTKEAKSEQVNSAKALWTIAKNELKTEDYEEFFKNLSYDREKPLKYVHTLAEGSLQYKSLFFIPATPPFDMNRVDYRSNVKLFVKRVFITDDDRELLPSYLRFIYGIIDSDDLPLNVSREILQENKTLEKIKSASVKKILGMIESLSQDEEAYKGFYAKYGKVLKEGLYGYGENRQKILDLVRAYSNKRGEAISLKAYKEGMKDGQDCIFYALGRDLDSLKNNPLLDKFKDYEVLLFSDEVDNFVIPQLDDYEGLKWVDVASKEASGKIKIEIDEERKKEFEGLKDSFKSLEGVNEVELIDGVVAPLVLTEENPQTGYMGQIMRQMGQEMPEPKKNIELNIGHELIQKLSKLDEAARARYALMLFNGAKILEGQSLKDAKSYVDGINDLLLKSL